MVEARQTTWEIVRRMCSCGVAVLLTTHYLDEAERLADAVVIMRAGRAAMAGSPTNLTSAAGIDRIRLRSRPGLAADCLLGLWAVGGLIAVVLWFRWE